MIKKIISLSMLLLCFLAVKAQRESQTEYNFLRLPVSARVASLGGENISLAEDDPSLIFHNPALISFVSDKTFNLNYMYYMEGINTGSVSFIKATGSRGTWGVMAQYMDYGSSIKETTEENVDLGTFSAKDIMIGGTFTYLLADKLAGGVSLKYITSYIAGYNSMAIGVDLGLNYFVPESEWSLSAMIKNLGGQIKAWEDEFEAIPLDVQIGISKRFVGSPLRLSLTLSRLNDWDIKFVNHIALGLELIITKNIYVAGGYNFRLANEMKIPETDGESSHGAGLSIGAGLLLSQFKVQLSYAKYHISGASLAINLAYSL